MRPVTRQETFPFDIIYFKNQSIVQSIAEFLYLGLVDRIILQVSISAHKEKLEVA